MVLALPLCFGLVNGQVPFANPQPGDIYREYYHTMRPADGDEWRVTDPLIDVNKYPAVVELNLLPNPHVGITIDDLQGAIRAEAVITIWNGHIGTWKKKIRFNDNAWIPIPELGASNGIPAGHNGQCYMGEYNVSVDIPLGNLVQGANVFDGENEGQDCYSFDTGNRGWGQFGWYNIIIRIYYNSSKLHPTGQITSPQQGGTFTDNATVSANVSSGVDRVDFLAYYNGLDTDGDGVFQEYHHDYESPRLQTGINIRNHVGTATAAPWQATWNTSWVPDQDAGSIKVLARVRDASTQIWYVTPEVSGLSLQRNGTSVKMYKPLNVPERMWSQDGNTPIPRSNVNIPPEDNLGNAVDAVMHIRTWDNLDGEAPAGHYTKLNNWYAPNYGEDHYFSDDILSVPPGEILSGTNTFEIYSPATGSHGIEVLWPGPELLVKFNGNYQSPKPGLPLLASPANNSGSQPSTPTLVWNSAPAATSYRLQVGTDSLFTAVVFDDSTITTTSRQVGPLTNLTRHFWRVRGKNAAGAGAFSSVWSFTTFLAAAAQVSPANNAINQTTSLNVVWHRLAGVTSYGLQVSTDASFSVGFVVNETGITDTMKALTGLTNNTQYFWRLNSRDAGGSTSAWGSSWSYTTVVSQAAVPSLIVPGNNAINQPLTTSLIWNSSSGAAAYHIQVSTDPAFAGGIVADDSTLADSTKTVSGLAYSTRYYWHVSAKNGAGASPYSATWNYTTISAGPAMASLLAPPNGANAQPTIGLILRWDKLPGATSYRLQLGTDSTFSSSLLKDDSTLVDSFRVVNGLTQFTRYYWRVNGKNAGGTGPFSQFWTFMTVIPAPSQVALVSPADLATIGSSSLNLTWHASQPGVNRYWVETAIDPGFAFLAVDSTVADTIKTMSGLLNNQLYYWRVRGGNPGGWGPYSDARRFTISLTGVALHTGIPQEFGLTQNYPNPFNPSTQIEFALPTASHVRLEVYNVLGQQVALLVDAMRPAGYQAVEFNAGGLPSGLYLYRLTTGEHQFMKKMMLVK